MSNDTRILDKGTVAKKQNSLKEIAKALGVNFSLEKQHGV